LIEVFLKVFNTRKTIARFLKAVIEMEVFVTGSLCFFWWCRATPRLTVLHHPFADHESTLFRGNSFATRILTVYARARGYHYLRNTLKDLLLTLCQKPPEFSMVGPLQNVVEGKLC
jgi:neurofibromin 1